MALTDCRPMGRPRQAPQEPQPAIALPDRGPAFHPVQAEGVRERGHKGGGKGKGQQPAIQDSPPRRARPPLSIADRAEEPATRRRRHNHLEHDADLNLQHQHQMQKHNHQKADGEEEIN